MENKVSEIKYTIGDLTTKAEKMLADFSQPRMAQEPEKEPYFKVVVDGIIADQKAILFLVGLLTKHYALVEAAKNVDCNCTVSQRLSGHLLGCWKPDFDEAMDKATAAANE